MSQTNWENCNSVTLILLHEKPSGYMWDVDLNNFPQVCPIEEKNKKLSDNLTLLSLNHHFVIYFSFIEYLFSLQDIL